MRSQDGGPWGRVDGSQQPWYARAVNTGAGVGVPANRRATGRSARVTTVLLLVLGGTVAGALLVEAGYRVGRHWVCLGRDAPPFWTSDPDYGWTHRAGASGWLYGCVGKRFEWRTFTRINAHGLRDREHEYAKPPGITRVLILGDSMTEGLQVPLERTFASILERGLHDAGRAVEVINAGVKGFGTDNELLFFRKEGIRYAPDIVLLVFNVENDVAENSPALRARMYADDPDDLEPKRYFRLQSDGRPIADDHLIPARRTLATRTSLTDVIERNSYVVRMTLRMVASASRSAPHLRYPVAFDVYRTVSDLEWSNAWAVTFAVVRALRSDVEQSGARFAVVVLPGREGVSPAEWERFRLMFPELDREPRSLDMPPKRINAFLEDERIPYLNAMSALRTAFARTGSLGFFGWDIHLNEDGHRVIAEALLPFVQDLLPSGDETPAS